MVLTSTQVRGNTNSRTWSPSLSQLPGRASASGSRASWWPCWGRIPTVMGQQTSPTDGHVPLHLTPWASLTPPAPTTLPALPFLVCCPQDVRALGTLDWSGSDRASVQCSVTRLGVPGLSGKIHIFTQSKITGKPMGVQQVQLGKVNEFISQ